MGKTKKINICGVEYTVNYIEPNSRDDTFMGRSDPQKALITINSTMAEDVQRQTLIHEWLHAVLMNYSLPENDNEILVQTIASELFRNGIVISSVCKGAAERIEELEKQVESMTDTLKAIATDTNEHITHNVAQNELDKWEV